MKNFDKNNWCVAYKRPHEKFEKLFKSITRENGWSFTHDYYGYKDGGVSWSNFASFTTLYTIDEVLDAYGEPEYKVGELYQFSDDDNDSNSWTFPQTYEFTKYGLFWARPHIDRLIGYKHIRPVPKAKMTDKEFIEKVLNIYKENPTLFSAANRLRELCEQYKSEQS